MKLKQGHCVATSNITAENLPHILNAFRNSGCIVGDGFAINNIKHFRFLEWHDHRLTKTDQVDYPDFLLTVDQILGADDKPHFDFSRRPNGSSKLIADLDHIKMMTEPGKSRYVHGCYTEDDAKNVIEYFNANPQFTKELRIKSYEQSGSDVYIFYKKPGANDWHERGELPPVGTECEISNCGQEWEKVKILYIGTELCVCDCYTHTDQHFHLSSVKFRPLKTERERAIEEMCKEIESNPEIQKYNKNIGCSALLRFAIEALYDAGFRKEGK